MQDNATIKEYYILHDQMEYLNNLNRNAFINWIHDAMLFGKTYPIIGFEGETYLDILSIYMKANGKLRARFSNAVSQLLKDWKPESAPYGQYLADLIYLSCAIGGNACLKRLEYFILEYKSYLIGKYPNEIYKTHREDYYLQSLRAIAGLSGEVPNEALMATCKEIMDRIHHAEGHHSTFDNYAALCFRILARFKPANSDESLFFYFDDLVNISRLYGHFSLNHELQALAAYPGFFSLLKNYIEYLSSNLSANDNINTHKLIFIEASIKAAGLEGFPEKDFLDRMANYSTLYRELRNEVLTVTLKGTNDFKSFMRWCEGRFLSSSAHPEDVEATLARFYYEGQQKNILLEYGQECCPDERYLQILRDIQLSLEGRESFEPSINAQIDEFKDLSVRRTKIHINEILKGLSVSTKSSILNKVNMVKALQIQENYSYGHYQ